MKFESVKDEDVVTKEFLDVKEPKQMDICLTWKKNYKEIDLRSNELRTTSYLGKAVKTTIEISYDLGLFNNFDQADEVLKDYLLTEVNERRRHGLNE